MSFIGGQSIFSEALRDMDGMVGKNASGLA
jgi:hypothetical protein